MAASPEPDAAEEQAAVTESEPEPAFFVAARGHHADVGGIQPGSMPPFSQRIDEEGVLLGIFTDSDLARLFERRREAMLDRPIGDAMTGNPVQATVGSSVAEAIEALRSRKLSELPVVDRGGHLVGLVDVTDLIGLVPAELVEG